MKTILKTIVCFFITFNIQAQEGLDVTLSTFPYDYQKGVYLKDLNNVITPYLGTWEGTLNGKKYTFVIQKFTKIRNGDLSQFYYYEDCVFSKFKVTDLASNTIIYSSLDAINYSDFNIFGIPIDNQNNMECIFVDTVANCNNRLSFVLKLIADNPNQLLYCLFSYTEYWKNDWDPCPFVNRADIPVNIPKENLVLTKI